MIEPRVAVEADLPTLLGWFDARVAWLNKRGIPGQWGTEPISDKEAFVARVRGWIEAREAFVLDGIGMIALSDAPPSYAAMDWVEGAAFVSALITATAPEARGMGRRLMAWAEGRASGRPALRLDCWADGDFLEDYYARLGFTRIGEFTVGPFHGAVMEKRLWASPPKPGR